MGETGGKSATGAIRIPKAEGWSSKFRTLHPLDCLTHPRFSRKSARISLRSPHNLHTVYEEFTGLECLLGKVEAQEYAGSIHTNSGAGHEEHSPPSVSVHDLSLACHIDHSSNSDIADDARTSHPSFSMDEL